MRSLVETRAWWLIALLASCNYSSHFADCAVACTAASGCPDGLVCGAEGYCRAEGTRSCDGLSPDGSAPPDGATDAATDDAHPPIDAPPIVPPGCDSSARCGTGVMLGTVSGDTGNQKLTAMGHDSAWLRVRVTEDNASFPGMMLRVSAKLTSPSAVDFDVFTYVDPMADVVECSKALGTKSTTANVRTVRGEWGEDTIPNNLDDSRTVSIEIRPIHGACTASQVWQLEVEGNWK